jgi:hypothetical protein
MRRVRGFTLLAVALVAVTPSAAAEADAAPIRECDSAGWLYGGQLRISNVTSRAVPCPSARRFARRYILYGGPACSEDRYCTYRGWSCTNVGYQVGRAYEIDSRCVKGRRVVRWQSRGR